MRSRHFAVVSHTFLDVLQQQRKKRVSHGRRGVSLSLVERLNLIRVVSEKKMMMMAMTMLMFFSAPLSHGINTYEDIKKNRFRYS